MNQASLAKWLKAIIIGLALCGIVLYAVVVPIVANETVASWPEFEIVACPGSFSSGSPVFRALSPCF